MKNIIPAIVGVLAAFCTLGCGEVPLPPDGTFTVSAPSRTGFPAGQAMDGDRAMGWIGRRKANDTTFQVFEIDFGIQKTFQTVTLDDSFPAGYTNEPPEYVSVRPAYDRGDVSSLRKGTSVASVLNGRADGQSWFSEGIPTEEAPQWLWVSFQSPVEALKIQIHNQMNNSVPVRFELYAANGTIDPRDKAEYSDPANYRLLYRAEENAHNVVDIPLPEAETITDLLYRVTAQDNEGEAVEASLDEIFVYGSAEGYTESHQPVRFNFMGSSDGENYTVFCEESGNYSEIWTHTLEEPLTCRYVKYLVFEENNNNYPSIGELTFS